jgi:hypothetical protein
LKLYLILTLLTPQEILWAMCSILQPIWPFLSCLELCSDWVWHYYSRCSSCQLQHTLVQNYWH